MNIDFKLRHIQFQHFLADRLSLQAVCRKHTHLIGIRNGRLETIIGCDTGKRIILVLQRLRKSPAGCLQKVFHGNIIDRKSQCQRIDKHTDSLTHFQVTSSTADRTQIDIPIIGIPGNDIRHCRIEQMSRSNIMAPAETGHFLVIDRTTSLPYPAFLIGFLKVCRNLTGSFVCLELFGKELFSFPERFGLLCLHLVVDKIQESIGLRTDSLPFQCLTDLTDKQIHRTTVEYQVMDIHQQMNSRRCLYHFKTPERCLLKIKRSDKLLLIECELLFRHGLYRHLYGKICIQVLSDSLALCFKTDVHGSMSVNHRFDGICQLTGISPRRVSQQTGYVIDRRERILHTFKINAGLCIRQRS